MNKKNKKRVLLKGFLITMSSALVIGGSIGTYAHFDPEFDGLNKKEDKVEVKNIDVRLSEFNESLKRTINSSTDSAEVELSNSEEEEFNQLKQVVSETGSEKHKELIKLIESVMEKIKANNFDSAKKVAVKLTEALSTFVEEVAPLNKSTEKTNETTEPSQPQNLELPVTEEKETTTEETPTEISSVPKPVKVLPLSQENAQTKEEEAENAINAIRQAAENWIRENDKEVPEDLIPIVLDFVEYASKDAKDNSTQTSLSLLKIAKFKLLHSFHITPEQKITLKETLLLGGRHPNDPIPTPEQKVFKQIDASHYAVKVAKYKRDIIPTLPTLSTVELKEIATGLNIDSEVTRAELVKNIKAEIDLLQWRNTRVPNIIEQVRTLGAIDENTNVRSSALTLILEDSFNDVKRYTGLVFDDVSANKFPKQQSIIDELKGDWLEPTGAIYTEIYSKIQTYKTIGEVIEIRDLIYNALFRITKAMALEKGLDTYRGPIWNFENWLKPMQVAILTLQGVKDDGSDTYKEQVREPIQALFIRTHTFILKIQYETQLETTFAPLKEELKTLTGKAKEKLEAFITKYETKAKQLVNEDYSRESLYALTPLHNPTKETSYFRELHELTTLIDNPSLFLNTHSRLFELETVAKTYNYKVYWVTNKYGDENNYWDILCIEQKAIQAVLGVYNQLGTTAAQFAVDQPELNTRLQAIWTKSIALVDNYQVVTDEEFQTQKEELLTELKSLSLAFDEYSATVVPEPNNSNQWWLVDRFGNLAPEDGRRVLVNEKTLKIFKVRQGLKSLHHYLSNIL